MKKRYSSPCIRFTVNIKRNGKQFPITFPLWDNENRRRFIIIEDEEVQKQLESLYDFGRYFVLDPGYTDTDSIQAEAVSAQNNLTHEVETLAEAKKYLAELGIKVYPSMNKGKAIEAAAEQNIELIIKK
jgi:hypothetical protein